MKPVHAFISAVIILITILAISVIVNKTDTQTVVHPEEVAIEWQTNR